LQAVVELFDERRGQWHVGIGELGQHVNELFRIAFGSGVHAVCPRDGGIVFCASLRNAYADTAQVFQQRQLQHDRKSPQFAQFERLGGLIGGDELGSVVAVDAAIHMGDEFQRQVVDARKSGHRTLGQPW